MTFSFYFREPITLKDHILQTLLTQQDAQELMLSIIEHFYPCKFDWRENGYHCFCHAYAFIKDRGENISVTNLENKANYPMRIACSFELQRVEELSITNEMLLKNINRLKIEKVFIYNKSLSTRDMNKLKNESIQIERLNKIFYKTKTGNKIGLLLPNSAIITDANSILPYIWYASRSNDNLENPPIIIRLD
jgi:hypothetical protein